MATCKDCIHYNVCDDDIIDFYTDKNKVCRQFKTSDVVEVVRCRDCVNSRPLCDTEKQLYCENCVGCMQLSTSYHSVIMFEDSFCSYGVRKEVD